MKIREIIFFCSLPIFSGGCSDYIEYESVTTCRTISSQIVERAEFEYLPALKKVKTLEEYYAVVEKYYPLAKRNGETLLKCMRSSALVASDEDTSNWIPIGVGITALSHGWELELEEKGKREENEVDYLVSSTISDIKFMLEK